MGIDEQFFQHGEPLERHHEHLVWGPGKQGAATTDSNVTQAYKALGEQQIGPLESMEPLSRSILMIASPMVPAYRFALYPFLNGTRIQEQPDRMVEQTMQT